MHSDDSDGDSDRNSDDGSDGNSDVDPSIARVAALASMTANNLLAAANTAHRIAAGSNESGMSPLSSINS